MTRTVPSFSLIRTLLPLALAALVIAACATDHVDADFVAVEGPSAAGTGLAPMVVSGAFDESTELFIRLDGSDLLFGGERMAISGGSSLAGSLPGGDFVIELVDAAGNVLLRTSQLSFQPGYVNDLLIYGDPSSLAYNYNSYAWDQVAEGKVQANFFNATTRRVAGRLDLCTLDTGGGKTCDVLAASLAYGAGWTGEVAPGTRFEFVPDVADGDRVEFWSPEHGEEGYAPGRMTRVNSYYPLDWVNFDDAECPGCTSSLGSTEDMFINP